MGKVNPLIHIYAVDSDTEQMHKQTFVDAWYAAIRAYNIGFAREMIVEEAEDCFDTLMNKLDKR